MNLICFEKVSPCHLRCFSNTVLRSQSLHTFTSNFILLAAKIDEVFLLLWPARHASYWRLDSIKNNSLLYLIYSLVVGGNFVLKPWPHVWFKFSQKNFSQKFDQDSHLIPWTCEDEMYLFVYSLPLHLSFFFLPSSAPTRRSLLAPKILPFLTYLFSSTTQHLQSSCPEKNPLKTKSSDTKSFAFG
jgi:hypothetical protein